MTGSPETLCSIRYPAKPGLIIGAEMQAWRKGDSSELNHLTLGLKIKFWTGRVHNFYLSMEEVLSVLKTLFGERRCKVEEQIFEGLFVHVKYEVGTQGPAMLVAIFGNATHGENIWQPHKPFFAESTHY